jgi:hypothetical protein
MLKKKSVHWGFITICSVFLEDFFSSTYDRNVDEFESMLDAAIK